MTTNFDEIKKKIKLNNSVVQYDLSIAGESLRGLSLITTVLTFAYQHFKNETYHPYLFNNLIGVSIGTIVIDLLIKSCYLYEYFGKKAGMRYIKSVLASLNTKIIRKLFFDLHNEELSFFNSYKMLINFVTNGAFFTRDAIIDLLLGVNGLTDIPNKNVFTTKEFYDWLDIRLKNVFFVCYNNESTASTVFNGDYKKYNKCSYIKYEKLNSANYIYAIRCSSSIPLVYPSENLNGVEYCIDGAVVSCNIAHIMSTLLNSSYFYSFNEKYESMCNFFELDEKNDNFIIHNNLVQIQKTYENIQTFATFSGFKPIQTLQTLFTLIPRILYNSQINSNLESIYLSQPYVKEFSHNNMNLLVSNSLEIPQRIINLKSNTNKIKNIKLNDYDKDTFIKTYDSILKNQPYSTYIYDITEEKYDLGSNKSINIFNMVTNVFIRNNYDFDTNKFYLSLFFNINKDFMNEQLLLNHGMGILNGMSMYYFYEKQHPISYDQLQTLKEQSYADFK